MPLNMPLMKLEDPQNPRGGNQPSLKKFLEDRDPNDQVETLLEALREIEIFKGEYKIGKRTIALSLKPGVRNTLKACITIRSGDSTLVIDSEDKDGYFFRRNGALLDINNPEIRFGVNVLMQNIGAEAEIEYDAESKRPQQTIEQETHEQAEALLKM